jgi:hypothetical protein
VRCESARALCSWWGITAETAWRWRQALGVARLNEGSRLLLAQTAAERGRKLRGRKLPPEACERRLRTARELNLGQYLRPGAPPELRWTADELALLGTLPDEALAAKLGRPVNAVRIKRTRLGIASACDRRHKEKRACVSSCGRSASPDSPTGPRAPPSRTPPAERWRSAADSGGQPMDTEKVCGRCGTHCVPAQSYCPNCGSQLPAATPVPPGWAPTSRPYKLIVNRGTEERVFDCEDEEQAFDKAMPWVMQGYLARIADERGVVKWTQALSDGQLAVFKDDATEQRPGSGPPATSSQAMGPAQKPWWRFW